MATPILHYFISAFNTQTPYELTFSYPEDLVNKQVVLKLNNTYYIYDYEKNSLPRFEGDGAYRLNINLQDAIAYTISLAVYHGADALPLGAISDITHLSLSVWSNEIKIKKVQAPSIDINGWTVDTTHTLTTNKLVLNGHITTGAADSLKWYKIFLRQDAQDIETSDKIFLNPTDQGKFTYTFSTNLSTFASEKALILTVLYGTEQNYVECVQYDLFIATIERDADLTLSLAPSVNSVAGNIALTVSITNNTEETKIGTLSLLRKENGSLKWHTLYKDDGVQVASDAFSYTALDTVAESGINYLYKVVFTQATKQNEATIGVPISLYLDDLFLSQGNSAYCIQFNPEISSFKYIVGESFTQTIGAAYPFYRRNGHMKYRQFNISGLISRHQQSEEDIGEADLTAQEIQRERLFREGLMDFLYNPLPKLLRSPTEGNIIVQLSAISFTPNKQLGRMLYSFSATATEIADNTLDNYKKYNLYQQIAADDTFDPTVYNVYYVLGEKVNDEVVVYSEDHDAFTVYKESFDF